MSDATTELQSDLLTTAEAARLARCSVSTMRRAVRAGRVEAVIIGPKTWRIARDSICTPVPVGTDRGHRPVHDRRAAA